MDLISLLFYSLVLLFSFRNNIKAETKENDNKPPKYIFANLTNIYPYSIHDEPLVLNPYRNLTEAHPTRSVFIDGNYGPTTEITLKGTYYWLDIFDAINRHNKTIWKSFPVTRYTEYLYTRFVKAIKRNSNLADRSILDIKNVRVYVENKIDVSATAAFQHLIENRKEDKLIVTDDTGAYAFGYNSRIALYQLMFQSEGLNIATGVTSNAPRPNMNATIYCQIRQLLLIKEINVIFTNQSVDRPIDAITANNGKADPDINSGVATPHSWLVPIWTSNLDDVAMDFSFSSIPHSQICDILLCKDIFRPGMEDNRIYQILEPVKLATPIYHDKTVITKVGLVRTSKVYGTYRKINASEYGWNACTTDINECRTSGGGEDERLFQEWKESEHGFYGLPTMCNALFNLDRLYVCWNYRTIYLTA